MYLAAEGKHKKSPGLLRGFSIKFYAMSLSPGNVGRLKTFRAFHDFERNSITLCE